MLEVLILTLEQDPILILWLAATALHMTAVLFIAVTLRQLLQHHRAANQQQILRWRLRYQTGEFGHDLN